MKKKKSSLKTLIENYLVTFFIMWGTAIFIIGSDIIDDWNIFLPYIIISAFFYLSHLFLYKYLSYKHNRIAKNILFIFLPFVIIFSMFLLITVTEKPTLEEFTIVHTSRLPCGEKTITPRKYCNGFMIKREYKSQFQLKRNGHTITWYPNEENYYKYKQGDVIKVKVKKNFLGMEVIVQQNKDED